jgi:hypothetical protein
MRRGPVLSRDGVDHPLRRAVVTAAGLFQAGVDMAVTALWLGHESLETTHVCVEADLATKERALEKLAPMSGMPNRYSPWRGNHCRRSCTRR